MNIADKIISIRESLNVQYQRPPPEDIEMYKTALRNYDGAREYLESRGITTETAEYFNLGYSADCHGIAIPNYKNGELISVKYRKLGGEPKYLSEPNTEAYIYHDAGIEIGREKGAVLICEGQFDLMSLWQAGIKNAVSLQNGAQSYNPLIPLLEGIPRIWICMDNDAAGQKAARELADRLGVERCRNILLPTGVKDINDFFKEHNVDTMREMIAHAVPFYKYEFSGVGDVIQSIIDEPKEYLSTSLLPNVRLERDQLIVLSAVTNVGKTSWALNIVNELSSKGVPCLVFPFERGVHSVGKRFVQIVVGKTSEEMIFSTKEEWSEHMFRLADMPVYFATPTRDKMIESIKRAKKLFGVKFVVIDHLDYCVRQVAGNRETAISDTMQNLKRVAEENGVIIMVITHVRKLDEPGTTRPRRPTMDDLKGSSSLKQDPEVVAMLYPTDDSVGTVVDIMKNKGPMTSKVFRLSRDSGVVADDYEEYKRLTAQNDTSW